MCESELNVRDYVFEMFREVGVCLDQVDLHGWLFIVTMGGDGDFRWTAQPLTRSHVAKARQSKPSRGYSRRGGKLWRYLRDYLPPYGEPAPLLSREEQEALMDEIKNILPECVCTRDFDEMLSAVARSSELGDRGHELVFAARRGVSWIMGNRMD